MCEVHSLLWDRVEINKTRVYFRISPHMNEVTDKNLRSVYLMITCVIYLMELSIVQTIKH